MSQATNSSMVQAQPFNISATTVTEYYSKLLLEQHRIETMRLQMLLQQIEDAKKAFLENPETLLGNIAEEKAWLADHVRESKGFNNKKPSSYRGNAVIAVTPIECIMLFTFEEQERLASIIARAVLTGTAYTELDPTNPAGGIMYPLLAIWARNDWDEFQEEDDYM